MLERVVEHLVLVDVLAPFHGLVEHHEKEPVQRLSEESLEQNFVVDAFLNCHAATPSRGC